MLTRRTALLFGVTAAGISGAVLYNDYTLAKKGFIGEIPKWRRFGYICDTVFDARGYYRSLSITHFPERNVTERMFQHVKSDIDAKKVSYQEAINILPERYWHRLDFEKIMLKDVLPGVEFKKADGEPALGKLLIEHDIPLIKLDGHVLPAKDFNYYMDKKRFRLTKLTRKGEVHRGMDYSRGSDFTDVNRFYPSGSCNSGGLYFTIDNLCHIIETERGIGQMAYKRAVTVPNDSYVYVESNNESDTVYTKFKAPCIILGERYMLRN